MSKAELPQRPQRPDTASMSELGVMSLQSEQSAAQAQWERAILEELEAWHRAGDRIGVRDPNRLWDHYEVLLGDVRLKFIDRVALTIHQPGADWDTVYAIAAKAWDARLRFIEQGKKKDGQEQPLETGSQGG